jgi:hypothetical protein
MACQDSRSRPWRHVWLWRASSATFWRIRIHKRWIRRPTRDSTRSRPISGITYDSDIGQSGTALIVLDSTGSPVPVQPDRTSGRQSSVQPTSDLAPGPYTVAWTSLSADDGHTAQGFYTFVVNGGSAGIVDGRAESQAPAADLTTTLTVTSARTARHCCAWT